mgnify:CR=1 FL=1
MNAKWFKDHICDELKGAECYLKQSIDTMKSYPEWSETFYKMADMEQDHATNLYKMFMDMYTDTEGTDPYMKTMRDCIMDCFSTSMRKIEDYKVTYDMMVKQEARGIGYERNISGSVG